MRRFLLLAGLAAALVWTTQAPARAGCTAGWRTANGIAYLTWCGPARATLHLGGKTYAFSGGRCYRGAGAFAINLGSVTRPPNKRKLLYFGITVFAPHDGTFRNQGVAWQFSNGGRGSLDATIKLAGGRTKGTFAGATLAGVKGSGTFSCS